MFKMIRLNLQYAYKYDSPVDATLLRLQQGPMNRRLQVRQTKSKSCNSDPTTVDDEITQSLQNYKNQIVLHKLKF